MRSNHLRKGQIERDSPRNPELVQRQVRVARDDSPRREIDTLPHQVPAHPALLTFQPLRDRLYRPPAPLRRRRQPRERVVNIPGDVHLEEETKLGDDVLRGPALFLLLQPDIGLDNLAQLMRQVVLRPRAGIHRHAGPHRRRRHRKHREDHPLWPRMRRIESERHAVFVTDPPQDPQSLLRRQLLLSLQRPKPPGILLGGLGLRVIRLNRHRPRHNPILGLRVAVHVLLLARARLEKVPLPVLWI
mmetsp:Transcript_10215/g.27885  ORF Transcript_10215/g.27885 Transcript_10215/m.27885 type:complete len:245 (-) Transcript_10215:732-1466(-)